MSELADRAKVEELAKSQCGRDGSTHYDGCPCSLIRMDDLIDSLYSEMRWSAAHEYERGYADARKTDAD